MSPENIGQLTPREAEVLARAAEGLGNAGIAAVLLCSEETVRTHIHRTLVKLGCRNRTQAVICAYESGLVVPRGRRS